MPFAVVPLSTDDAPLGGLAWPAADAGEPSSDQSDAALIQDIRTRLVAIGDQVEQLRDRVAYRGMEETSVPEGFQRIEEGTTQVDHLLCELADAQAAGEVPSVAPRWSLTEVVQSAQAVDATNDAAEDELVKVRVARAERLLSQQPEVLPLSTVREADSVVRAVRAGAMRYLLNQSNAPEGWQAIKAAVLGQAVLSPEPAARLAREVVPLEQLSQRELDVLRLVASGRSNKSIAHDLTIAENTVKTHVSSILGKLDVESRTQAALYASRIGLVRPNGPETTTPVAASSASQPAQTHNARALHEGSAFRQKA
jgi:DNA-binding NarL/FixJ family response regulator